MMLALLVGVLIALQPVVNSRLASHVGTLPAATLSFLIGSAALVALTTLNAPGGIKAILSPDTLRQLPPILLTGGFVGAAVVYGSAKLIPQLGAAGMLTLTISGQLLTSAVSDHFGLFGLQRTPLGLPRLVGLLLLLVGATLALRRS
jgi:transporter family-2 protein